MSAAFCYAEGALYRIYPLLFLFRKDFEKMKEEQNLTTGSVPKKLIIFALPLLLANLWLLVAVFVAPAETDKPKHRTATKNVEIYFFIKIFLSSYNSMFYSPC